MVMELGRGGGGRTSVAGARFLGGGVEGMFPQEFFYF